MTRLYERLNKSTAPEMIEFYCKPHLEEDLKMFGYQMAIHKAHALMLAHQQIIPPEDARKILGALRELEARGVEALDLKPELNDLYTNVEAWLFRRIGSEVGGKLHTGRSRNDMFLTTQRMYVRHQLNRLAEAIQALIGALLQVAGRNLDAVMPGYTHHSQHAQPVSFGHFLLACADGFFRDLVRVANAYRITNQSPMGGAALATTGFPIDREMVASLLGFDGLVENSIDATGARDFQLEAGSAAAIAMSNLGRMSESFLLWNTFEFGMIEVPDEYCSISSIMPQKKNPVTLEVFRGQAVLVAGYVSTMFGVLKALPLANGREPGYVDHLMQACFDGSIPVLEIAAGLVRSLGVRRERMERLAADGYSTFTELADEIVRVTGLSFGQSRRIVGKLVNMATERGLSATQVTGEMLDEAARATVGRSLDIRPDILTKVLDPRYNVAVRDRKGGPSLSECARMLRDRQALLDAEREKTAERVTKLQRADSLLDARANELLKDANGLL